jgi:hypothetical protein
VIPLSYHAELEEAKKWRFAQTEAGLTAAKAALERLRVKYPHVLAVGHELILVLEKLGDLDGASRELQELERVFPKLDEETLSRGGKINKLLAATAPLGQANAYLRTAEEYYHRGYAISGGCYSRINELTVRLLRAAKLAESGNAPDAQKLLSNTRLEAAELLNTESWVAHRSDDNIWVPATQGEAAFLAGDWTTAERAYSRAKFAAAGKVFYLRTMCEQLKLLLEAYARLNVTPSRALADPDALFLIPD